MQAVYAVVRDLERIPDVVEDLTYFTNPLMYRLGVRLQVPRFGPFDADDSEQVASIRLTTVVEQVLALAKHGVTFNQLCLELQQAWPQVDSRDIRELVDQLRSQSVLVSELRPSLTKGDPGRNLIQKLSATSPAEGHFHTLRSVHEQLQDLGEMPIGCGIEKRQELQRQGKSLLDKDGSQFLAVDMATETLSSGFSYAVAEDLERAVRALLRLSTQPARMNHLERYQRRFTEYYGERREVPLLEVLDNEYGLGYPSGYGETIHENVTPNVNGIGRRNRTLMHLASAALRERRRELILDDDVIEELQVHEDWRQLSPDSCEVYAQIAAASQDELNQGDFLVVLGPRTGDRPAGRSFGRFATIMGEDAVEGIRRLARREEAMNSDEILAELAILPDRGHLANVAIRPAVRDYEVVAAAIPSVDDSTCIPLSDLLLGVDGDRFYVRSASRDKRVVPQSTHLLNHHFASGPCRFLTEIALDGRLPILPFDWGPAAELPFLPRVQVGRVVLAVAEWHLPAELLLPGPRAQSTHALDESLRRWMARWDLPQYVYLAHGDERLLLDLHKPWAVDELRREARALASTDAAITLQEMLPDFDQLWVQGPDGEYFGEFVVPFQRYSPVGTTQNGTSTEETPTKLPLQRLDDREYHIPPGGDWLYAKLYGAPSRQAELIAGPLNEFVIQVSKRMDIDRWFFIRYTDPDPHVRIRLHGDPDELTAVAVPHLLEWDWGINAAGLVRKLTIDTYDREVDRYGGPSGINVAERVFYHDSRTVAAILRMWELDELELSQIDVAVLTIDRLLRDLGIESVSERSHLVHSMMAGQQRAHEESLERFRDHFHDYWRSVQKILGNSEWLRSQSGGGAFVEVLEERTLALAPLQEELARNDNEGCLGVARSDFLFSCIHMHCNRLLGTDRTLEFEAL